MELIARAGHGVLSTIYAGQADAIRLIDSVPVVFAMRGRHILLPIDTLKPKKTTSLQRVRNLEADPRCTLLVENYDDAWDDLWWVRVHATAELRTAPENAAPAEISTDELKLLADKHPQYGEPDSIVGLIVLTVVILNGWRARAGTPRQE